MIGYYVHHQGDGHVTRAAAIARALGDERVCGLSSRPCPDDWPGEWVQLARDDEGPFAGETAGGALHWAPSGHAGLRERMAQISAWVATHAPRLFVVDVSVEVTVLVRSMGVPTVVMALPGVRDDYAHQLGYRLADAIIAPWPEWADVLHGGAQWRAKTVAVGAISRFEGRAAATGPDVSAAPGARPSGRAERIRRAGAPPVPAAPNVSAAPAAPLGPATPGGRTVLVLSGRGGTELTLDDLAAAQAETPGWTWTVLGPPGTRWVADPWSLLCAADVVVTHAGQNAIADVATARRPAVIVPQPRPFDEQATTARALGAAGLAVVCPRWPAGTWAETLERAVQMGGNGLGALERVGRRRPRSVDPRRPSPNIKRDSPSLCSTRR